jgi:peptide-methionine (S)-S-oxide reductase
MLFGRIPQLPTPEQALTGRPSLPYAVPDRHTVLGTPLLGPYPEGLEVADFGMGCFWGAERRFWQLPAGVYTTLVGYQGGYTQYPTYEEVCSGLTGHTEVVRVVHDPKVLSYERLLKTFWESHNPTQGFRQGNDVGTQYRSAIYTHTPDQATTAEASRLRHDHHRTPPLRRPPLLPGGGVPPAVPGQEPGRLLRARWYRCVLPDRCRAGRRLTSSGGVQDLRGPCARRAAAARATAHCPEACRRTVLSAGLQRDVGVYRRDGMSVPWSPQ